MQKKLFFYALFIGFLSSINGADRYQLPTTTKINRLNDYKNNLENNLELKSRPVVFLRIINQIEVNLNNKNNQFQKITSNNSTELSTLKDTISKLIDTLNLFKNDRALTASVTRVTTILSSLQTEVQLQLYKNDPTARAKFLDTFFEKYEKIPTEPKEEDYTEQPNPTKEIPFDDLITFLSDTGNVDLLENYKEFSVDVFVKYQKEFDTIRKNLFEKIRTLNTDADKETKEKYETLQTKLAQIQTNAFLNFFSGDIPTNLHSDLQVKKLATAIKLKETIDQKISKVKNRWNITKKWLSFLSHFLAPKTNKSLQKSIDELIKLGKNYQNDTGDTTLKSLQQRVEGVILFVNSKKTEKDENTKIQYTALLLENVFASKEINAHIKEILINKVIEVFISTNNPKAVSSLVDKINAYSTNPDLLHFIKVATLRPEAAASVSSVLEPSSTPEPKNSKSPSDGTKESKDWNLFDIEQLITLTSPSNNEIKEVIINKIINSNDPERELTILSSYIWQRPNLKEFIKDITSTVNEKLKNSKTDDRSNIQGHESLHSVDPTPSGSQPEDNSGSNVSDRLDQLIKKYKTATAPDKPEIIEEIAKIVVDKKIKIQELKTALQTNNFYASGDVYDLIQTQINKLQKNTGNQPRTFPNRDGVEPRGNEGTGESKGEDDHEGSEPRGR